MYEGGSSAGPVTGRPAPVVPRAPIPADAGVFPAGPDVVTALGAVPPGPVLAALAAAVDTGTATPDELIEVVAAAERVKCWLETVQARALTVFTAHRPGDTSIGVGYCQFAADEIAPALSIARRTAEDRIGFALGLDRLQATRTALAEGRIGLGVAHRIVEGLYPLPDGPALAAEPQILADAVGRTPAQVQARIARTVAALDPEAAGMRHRTALDERRVSCTPLPDGMAGIWAQLRADDAARVMARLRARAKAARTPGDGRTSEQRLADAFVDLHTTGPCHRHRRGEDGTAGTCGGCGGGARPAGPSVQVVVAASTLLGTDSQPGELAGYGPIPADLARAIAADPNGTWQRLLTDPTSGKLLDVGRTRYRPPAALADFVRTRDRTCRFPGCRQPARRCDLDHVQPYPGGPNSACNLATECRHHHRLKHQTTWTVDTDPDGPEILHWTSPTNRIYTSEPRPPLTPT
jgi:hypothetical protein